MSEDKLIGLYNVAYDGGAKEFYRVADSVDGGLIAEKWDEGKFVPSKLSIAEIMWHGFRVSSEEADNLKR